VFSLESGLRTLSTELSDLHDKFRRRAAGSRPNRPEVAPEDAVPAGGTAAAAPPVDRTELQRAWLRRQAGG